MNNRKITTIYRIYSCTAETFTVTILSEKHICESCSGVVEQFKAEYKNATVNIISGKRGYNGSPNGTKTWKHRKR
ncbi:MAG: deaminase domain-containing protein [Acutalibacteraceae bacterium]|nr:deaminase domain-containing protein [Acutalibacteraceae bacterium]